MSQLFSQSTHPTILSVEIYNLSDCANELKVEKKKKNRIKESNTQVINF